MKISNRRRHAPPKAGTLIEALRGLGYSISTALADIVDNSISAQAKCVDIQFSWSGSLSVITVLDDGVGMNEEELDLAMRLGDKNPLDARDSSDLGRFGLGLKTASFSQCRRLTVASCKNGQIHCLRWDLDVMASSTDDGWYLLEGPAEGSEHLLDGLDGKKNGTIVLWELNDRVITPGFYEQDFLDLIDRVERHLAMIYHRFLENSQVKLLLTINGRLILPWDPFLSTHSATWSSPVTSFITAGGTVEAQGYVLPHKDRLCPQTYEVSAGPDGWTGQQGFYVYRNKRLLLAGSWLSLGLGRSWTKEEPHRLARIRLDIPNTADLDWKIDIRKSTARPPVELRIPLTRLADDVRDRARRVFAHRGKAIGVGGAKSVTQAWCSEHFSGGVRYRIDRDHPAIKFVLEDAGPLKSEVNAMLRILEETIPVQRIWLDTAEAKETPQTSFAEEPTDQVLSVLLVLYKNMVIRKGMSADRARERLMTIEPFNNYPAIVHALPDNPVDQQKD